MLIGPSIVKILCLDRLSIGMECAWTVDGEHIVLGQYIGMECAWTVDSAACSHLII